MASELLEKMRRNPAGDWRIQDVEAVCREHGLLFRRWQGHFPLPCQASEGTRNIDHSGTASDQTGLHSTARALY
jgi:hypothetical protein